MGRRSQPKSQRAFRGDGLADKLNRDLDSAQRAEALDRNTWYRQMGYELPPRRGPKHREQCDTIRTAQSWAVRAWHIRRELRDTPLQQVTAEGFVPFVNVFSPRDAEQYALRIARREVIDKNVIARLGQQTLDGLYPEEIKNVYALNDAEVIQKRPAHLPIVHLFRIGADGPELDAEAEKMMNHRDSTDPTAGWQARVVIPVVDGTSEDETRDLVLETFEAPRHLTSPILIQSGPFEGLGHQDANGKVTHSWPVDTDAIFPSFYRVQ